MCCSTGLISKWKKSWVNLGQPSTLAAKQDRFDRKTMLCIWCVVYIKPIWTAI